MALAPDPANEYNTAVHLDALKSPLGRKRLQRIETERRKSIQERIGYMRRHEHEHPHYRGQRMLMEEVLRCRVG